MENPFEKPIMLKMFDEFPFAFKDLFNLNKALLINFTVYELFPSFGKSLPSENFVKGTHLDLTVIDTIKEKQDLLIGEMPFGLKFLGKTENTNTRLTGEQNIILRTLSLLSDEGYAIYPVPQSVYVGAKNQDFIHMLNERGFYINAILNTPKNLLPQTSLEISFLIISKKEQKEIFVAEITAESDYKVILNRYRGSQSDNENNLFNGFFIDFKSFESFGKYKIKSQLRTLGAQYKDFTTYKLNEIADSIKHRVGKKINDEENTIYVPRIGRSKVVAKLADLTLKHHNYYIINLRKEIADSGYVSLYLNSDIGKLNLEYLRSSGFIEVINKSDLESATIPLPPLNEQRYIVQTDSKIQRLKSIMNKFEEDIALNPMSSHTLQSKLDDLLETLDVLSKSDKVLALIRQGESKTVEFKQTLKMNIKTNQKDKEMERACLKTIVAFLNSDGGNLIIGVKDDGEIYGIDNDDYKSNDDYLKHFHNLIRDKIGEEFFPLINYHIVDINQKKILLVECGMSDTACYYEGKEFFVRTNPATDKLEGPKLVEYVGRRFKNK